MLKLWIIQNSLILLIIFTIILFVSEFLYVLSPPETNFWKKFVLFVLKWGSVMGIIITSGGWLLKITGKTELAQLLGD